MTTSTDASSLKVSEPRCLNLGCGSRFHPDWENLDLHPASPQVRSHDLRKRLPFPDGAFDVVYHSHVLEHFPRSQALSFLGECLRVLKQGGVIRVAVPDLQRIAKYYLDALEKASCGVPGWAEQYEWAVIEMYDQAVREFSGGNMVEFVRRAGPQQHEFIRQRLGCELDRMLADTTPPDSKRASLSTAVYQFAEALRLKALRILIGREGIRAYFLGRFRRSGEIHNWMYDRYSLALILERAGFSAIHTVSPMESRIHAWISYHLDTEPDGRIYKPDSLWVEAIRP